MTHDWNALLTTATEDFARTIGEVDPVAVVPSCPGWTVTDLVDHVGGVHQWARHAIVDGNPEGEPEAAERRPRGLVRRARGRRSGRAGRGRTRRAGLDVRHRADRRVVAAPPDPRDPDAHPRPARRRRPGRRVGDHSRPRLGRRRTRWRPSSTHARCGWAAPSRCPAPCAWSPPTSPTTSPSSSARPRRSSRCEHPRSTYC